MQNAPEIHAVHTSTCHCALVRLHSAGALKQNIASQAIWSERYLVMTAEAHLGLAVVIPAGGWVSHVGPDSAQGAEAMLEVVQGGRGGLTPQQAQRVHQPWNLHRQSVYYSFLHLLKTQLAELPELPNAASSLKQSPVCLLFKSLHVLRLCSGLLCADDIGGCTTSCLLDAVCNYGCC